MQIEKNLIHYTDYSFQKFYEEEYGINRGVYNTIDDWFFEKGIRDILKRRKEMLVFFKFIENKPRTNQKAKLRFGHGGLVTSLNEFWDEMIIQHDHKEVIKK